jgi:hypothetical protein
MKAIARGRQWYNDLLAGRVESVVAIVKREGVQPNYVRRLIRLAFLTPRLLKPSPQVSERLSLQQALTERIELPLLWDEQERAVGIS